MTRKKAEWEAGYEKAFNNPPPLKQVDPCNPLQDLTDDEMDDIYQAAKTGNLLELRRAVIAAYKEKNK